METQSRTLSGINVLAGIWLIIAPFVLNYRSGGNVWQEVVFGALVAVFGLVRLATSAVAWPSWINFFIGLWVLISPWIIAGTTTAARWNETIFGVVVAVLAYVSGALSPTHDGEGHMMHHAH